MEEIEVFEGLVFYWGLLNLVIAVFLIFMLALFFYVLWKTARDFWRGSKERKEMQRHKTELLTYFRKIYQEKKVTRIRFADLMQDRYQGKDELLQEVIQGLKALETEEYIRNIRWETENQPFWEIQFCFRLEDLDQINLEN